MPEQLRLIDSVAYDLEKVAGNRNFQCSHPRQAAAARQAAQILRRAQEEEDGEAAAAKLIAAAAAILADPGLDLPSIQTPEELERELQPRPAGIFDSQEDAYLARETDSQ